MKTNQLFRFAWEVCTGGYRTITGERQDDGEVEEALIEVLLADASYRSYSPLEEQSGLFRMFAELDASAIAIRSFANRFGLLGVPVPYRVFDDDKPYDQGGKAEPIAAWRQEIHLMKTAVDLWDMLRKKRTRQRRLEEAVRALMATAELFELTSAGPVVGRLAPPGGSRAIDEAEHDAFTDDFERERWRPAGRFLLRQILRRQLKMLTAPTVQMRPGEDRFDLSIAPEHLLGALWLLLARAASGEVTHRSCAADTCGQWFEISTRQEGYNKNREYCSNACRMRMHRKRKAQARRLAGDGRSVGEIAELIGSSKNAIRGWIGKKPLRLVR